MKIKKVTYNPEKVDSREKLANPFSNESIPERLKESGAVDLKDNCSFIEVAPGYVKTVIHDKSKKLKKGTE